MRKTFTFPPMTNPQHVLAFLDLLSRNNNREWFAEHREEYDEFKRHAEATAQEFIRLVAQYAPGASSLTPAQCTYRIFRDTRFSADKTPYKNHFGIFVNPPLGKKAESLGWYLHLQPGASIIAAGTGWSSPNVLKAIRQGIFDEIDEYREIVENPEFKAALPELGMDVLKTAPKGFDKNWPYIDYLKPRIFGASASLADDVFASDNWIQTLIPAVSQGAKYNRFCNYFVYEALGLEIDL